MESISKTYVDANLFIVALEGNGPEGERTREAIAKNQLITSALTLDEIMYVIQKKFGKNKVYQRIYALYKLNNLSIVPVEEHLPLEAAKLLAENNLRPRDAMHLVTMRRHNITTILSYDKDFDNIPGITRIEP